jgi:hypothetical protein
MIIEGFSTTITNDLAFLNQWFNKPEQRATQQEKITLVAVRMFSLALLAVGTISAYSALKSGALLKTITYLFAAAVGHDLFVISQNISNEGDSILTTVGNCFRAAVTDAVHAYNGNQQRIGEGRISVLTDRTFFPSTWNYIFMNMAKAANQTQSSSR